MSLRGCDCRRQTRSGRRCGHLLRVVSTAGNRLAGSERWSDYRSRAAPNAIRIEHHKTGAAVLHPLVDREDGVLLYPAAEAVLAKVPRCGLPMILKPVWINTKTGALKRRSEP